MPCYEPAPLFDGERKENAEHAVRILCDFIGKNLRKSNSAVWQSITQEMLYWYVAHKEIDLKIAQEVLKHPTATPSDRERVPEIFSEISMAKLALSSTRFTFTSDEDEANP